MTASSFFSRAVLLAALGTLLGACEGGLSAHGAPSSKPVNRVEAVEQKKALIRCHKTGGTRVVKIQGTLRCF